MISITVPKIIEEAYQDLGMGIPNRYVISKTYRLSEVIHCLHSFVMLVFSGLLVFSPSFVDFLESKLMVFVGVLAYLFSFPLIFIYYNMKKQKQYKAELALLVIFTIYSSFAVGLTCALTNGRVIMESAILTAVAVMSLTLFTFQAALKRPDSTIPTRIIFAGVVILLVVILIQIIVPLEKLRIMV